MAERRHSGQHGEDCFPCKIQSVSLDPRAVPSRRNVVAPRRDETANAWNRGVVTDDRGMPWLSAKSGVMTVKERADNRHAHRERERQLARETALSTTH